MGNGNGRQHQLSLLVVTQFGRRLLDNRLFGPKNLIFPVDLAPRRLSSTRSCGMNPRMPCRNLSGQDGTVMRYRDIPVYRATITNISSFFYKDLQLWSKPENHIKSTHRLWFGLPYASNFLQKLVDDFSWPGHIGLWMVDPFKTRGTRRLPNWNKLLV